MTELQIFESPDFGRVRTTEIDGKPYFCGADVAKALGYAKPRNAIERHCKGALKRGGVSQTTNQYGVTTNQTVEMSFIPEGDVYRLIVGSKLPTAEKFERWVFDEVLPSIRRDGGYMHTSPDMTDEEIMARAVLLGQKKIEEQAKRIQEMRPKEIFADRVSASESSILVGDLAKLLKQNGVDMGQKRLFRWLRDKGYLIKYGVSYNLPTQRSMELGLFEIKETTITHADGHISISKTVKVTGKGQVYFVNKFLLKERA